MASPILRSVKRRQVKKKILKPQPARKSNACRVPRPGQRCSQCGKAKLDYDGLLQLCCPACGYLASGGSFT